MKLHLLAYTVAVNSLFVKFPLSTIRKYCVSMTYFNSYLLFVYYFNLAITWEQMYIIMCLNNHTELLKTL